MWVMEKGGSFGFCFLMRMRLESCARENLFIVKSLVLHVVALAKASRWSYLRLQKVHVRVCACARVPVHTQEGHTGLQQECETCRQERQTVSASCQQEQGGEQLFLVLRP